MNVMSSHRGPATNVRRRLDSELFDRLTAKRGADTVAAKAQLVGLTDRTVYRLRKGAPPSLDSADQIAAALKTPLNRLFPRETA